MKRAELFKAIGATVLLGIGALLVYRQLGGRAAPGEQGFYFDVSAGKIFRGPRAAAPPIRGIDGPDEDGFRALVISTNGRPEDRRSWQVAYLEKFSPELKRATEEAQRTGEALAMGRLHSQTHRFVRRLEDTEWHSMDTPEAEAILGGWARPGPDGTTPVICSP